MIRKSDLGPHFLALSVIISRGYPWRTSNPADWLSKRVFNFNIDPLSQHPVASREEHLQGRCIVSRRVIVPRQLYM